MRLRQRPPSRRFCLVIGGRTSRSRSRSRSESRRSSRRISISSSISSSSSSRRGTLALFCLGGTPKPLEVAHERLYSFVGACSVASSEDIIWQLLVGRTAWLWFFG